jgi:outer membrane protein assembly factor BamB
MFGNGRIFISHTHEDNQRCQPLLAALDAWQVTYWFDLQELDAGQRFSDRIQQALDQSDIFLRISTPAAGRSFWMDRELRAARGLTSAFADHPRLIIHLVLAANSGMGPVDAGPREIVIDATSGPRTLWLKELRQALGIGAPRRVSRRTAIAAGVASVAAAASTALAAKVFLSPPSVTANPFHPKGVPYLPTPAANALPVRWQYSLDFEAPAENNSTGSSDLFVGLAADETAIYALSPTSQVLLAMSLHDSSILWLYPDQSSTPRSTLTGSTVTTAGGKIYLLTELDVIGGSSTFNLICLEPAKGTVVWKTPDLGGSTGITYPASVSNLCVANSAIYFQLDGKLYGFGQNGSPLWPSLPLHDFNIEETSVSTPAYADGLVFVGTNDGKLLAVNAATGAISWSIQLATGNFAPIQSSPAAAGGFVFIGAPDGYCYAFTAATGSLAWKTQLINLATYNQKLFSPDYFAEMGTPLVANGRVYLQAGANNFWSHTLDGLLFALDASTGKQLWKVDPTKLALPFPKIPTITGIPTVRSWYSTGNLLYTTLGFASNNAAPPVELASVEALLTLNPQDGSLHSYFLAPVDGQSLSAGYFPSAPVPIPGGVAYMTNEPEIFVLDV